MDHYSILGVAQTATKEEIKKAYKKLAIKYHPDKTGGDKESEERFKKISDSYAILGDDQKRAAYDRTQSNRSTGETRFSWSTNESGQSGFGFDEFVRNFSDSTFRQKASERAKRTQGRVHPTPPSSEHLNINIYDKLDLVDAILGKKLELTFSREKINYTGKAGNLLTFDKVSEEKEIAITIDLRKKYIIIKKDGTKYFVSARVPKLGNEDVTSQIGIWGELEQVPIIGDLHVTLELEVPENIKIEGNKIVQIIDLPLTRVIFNDEKTKIETIVNKKYEVDFNSPRSASNLKFSIPNEGILDEQGKLGEYLVKFNVTLPQVDDVSEEDLNKLKSILLDCENKT